ncbi:hypothetical protein [uncultured Aquabacterium sp.]|uniref:hypothetical protein n=1 Tax=uncultured Aquabacterium sp. TaxID=158753 RepID=UPI0025E9B66D|nr:hypothetical protein [uncultured Aquabacterium sp.]
MTDTQAQEAVIQDGYSERLAVALETDWSGVLLPTRQKAAALLRSQAARIAELEKASERMTNNRDMWKGQCERQAAELARMREPLTDVEIRDIGALQDPRVVVHREVLAFARAVEAAHGITKTGGGV